MTGGARGRLRGPAVPGRVGRWHELAARAIAAPVLDEVSNTDDTLQIATGLFQRAFPTADVRGCHWMTLGPVAERSGLRRTAEVPVWYRPDTWECRLVGNRVESAARPVTERSKAGGLFLWTRPPAPVRPVVQLRWEARQVVVGVSAGRLLARPAASRGIEVGEDRVQPQYGYTDLRALTGVRIEHAGAG